MKENRKLLKEVLKDIRRDMSDEEVLNLLANSKISVRPENEKDKCTLGQRAADAIAKFAGSWAFIFSFTGVLIIWMVINIILASKAPAGFRSAVVRSFHMRLRNCSSHHRHKSTIKTEYASRS